ncbi:hypothetical protein IL306_002320 [Fusarium sp. DS 682]|nr:hypothetical protein IL306_002320 [Fusarium sp. DS 682]
MQSKIALAGLALVGFAVGGPCKPSSRTIVSSLSVTSSVVTVDISESSTDSRTNINSLTITSSAETTEVPNLTVPQSSTTTEEEVIIITNAILGGAFASRDPNSPSGPTNFAASGNVEFHQGGCYRADGSIDDGCAALSASGNSDTKRSFFSSFASIYQTVRSVPRKKYTIQFFYLVNSAGSQGCVASATFGNTEFYSQPASNPRGAFWARVLGQVEAVSDLPTFAISLTCSGAGTSSILVDSIFISDRVTPDTINDFKLDLGGNPPTETTTTIRAEESPFRTTRPSEPTRISGLQNTSTEKPISAASSEVSSDTVTDTKSNESNPKTSNTAQESSATMTTSLAERTSESVTEITTTRSPPTSLAVGETSTASSPETTGPVSQEISSTSQPDTTTTSQPTNTACKTTCETIEDFYLHLDDFGCDLNGVFVNSDAIYTLPAEEVGATQTHWYNSNEECAAICKTLPGCMSAGFQRLSGRCFYSNTLVTRDDIRDGRDSQMVHWFGMECFTCSCGSGETLTSAVPTTTRVRELTSFVTTAKATQPTGVCHNNSGQQCEINPSSVDNNDYVCIGGGVFTGQTWTVPRSMYPMQENAEQCAAICDTLENCESSGFFGMENHCLFTTTKIQSSDFAEPDPNYDDPGLDPKNSVWSHRSCWTCPTCVLSNAPLPKSPTCNYKLGDSCARVSADGVMCNYSGMLPGTFGIDGSVYTDQSSSGKCAAICRKMAWCLGSGYRNGQCMFSRKTLMPDDFLDKHTYDFVWDDPSCFECPGCST